MNRSAATVVILAIVVVAGASFAFGRHLRKGDQDIIYRDGMKYGCSMLARSEADAKACTNTTYSPPQSYPGMNGFSR